MEFKMYQIQKSRWKQVFQKLKSGEEENGRGLRNTLYLSREWRRAETSFFWLWPSSARPPPFIGNPFSQIQRNHNSTFPVAARISTLRISILEQKDPRSRGTRANNSILVSLMCKDNQRAQKGGGVVRATDPVFLRIVEWY